MTTAPFTHGYEISVWNGKEVTYVRGGAYSFDDAREKRIAREWELLAHGLRSLGSHEFETKFIAARQSATAA